jgi:endoglucanase
MHRRELLKQLGIAGVLLHPAVEALAKGQVSSVDIPRNDPHNGSGAVATNQLGYLPGALKQASVRSSDVTDSKTRPFLVRSLAKNAVVLRTALGRPALDAASGDWIRTADFSSLRTPGRYRIETAGMVSDEFVISQDVYATALKTTMRSFYGQRCGCAVNLGGGYAHPACHVAGAFHPTSGKSGVLPNHGGWHDAGDYGRYAVNSGISTGTLLWAWELFPQPLKALSLEIPESGGKLPDYLAEVRWNLEWLLQMQDADGGVWHKQTSEKFCAFIMPQDDAMTSYVIGTGTTPFKNTGATADLAAVLAIAARCYGVYDDEFAKRCLDAARQAWSWAIAYPDVLFENPTGISTGGYGDRNCSDEILWASAELWRTTGEAQYEKAFLDGLPKSALTEDAPGWGDVASMAAWTYALAERPGSAEVKDEIRSATLAAAHELAQRSQSAGYGNTLGLHNYVWGSNGTAGNQSLLLLIADRFHSDGALRDAAMSNLHYLLGRNCFGVSWVTGLGLRPFQHPHHRPSAADGIAAPWPGLLSGGPNAGGGDAVWAKLPKQPPMRMWVDDEAAYSLNEIAINWNAPLVFLLAASNA